MDNAGEKEAWMLTPCVTHLALPHLSGYSPGAGGFSKCESEQASLQPPSSIVDNMHHRCILASV